MKAFKGFKKDMTCQGFQYKEGGEYETEKRPVKCTKNGFHSCENPIDIFGYYGPAESVYREVDVSGEISRDEEDSKIASSYIKIGAEISIKSIVDAGIKFIFENCDWSKKENHATGHQAASSATGNQAASSATGNQAASSATGDRAASSATGDQAASSATGYRAASSATGNRAASVTTGNNSSSEIKNTEKIVSINSVAIAIGENSKVKAPMGCWMSIAEYDLKGIEIIKIHSKKVEGIKIKADTWYAVKNGKLYEVVR